MARLTEAQSARAGAPAGGNVLLGHLSAGDDIGVTQL